MSSTRRNINLLGIFFMLVSLSSCVKELFSNEDSDATAIEFKVAARADETPTSARFIVFNHNKIIKNEIIAEENGSYPLQLFKGEYRLVILINEPSEITSALNNATALRDLQAIQLNSSQRESNIVLVSNNMINVTTVAGQPTQGLVSVDGAPATQNPEIEIKRAQAKTTLYMRKYTKKNGLPDDRIVIKKVTLCNVPKYSYLLPNYYTEATFNKQVIYDNATGILLDQDVTDAQYAVKDKVTEGAYSNVVLEVPTDTDPTNIFPEYMMQDPTNSANAAYLLVEASYTSKGATTDVSYTLPALRANELIENYNLNRNHNYIVYLTLTQRGVFDSFEVTYTVKDWEGQDVNVDINKDPFLDITNINVNAYDAAVTRVYFYSNQTADNVFVSPIGHIGSESGTAFNVKDEFHKLVPDNTGGTPESADNFHYEFDVNTGVGKGYIDIINLKTSTAGSQTRVINLIAGKIIRTITINSTISEEAAKRITVPYIGTFHRANEHSERLITWHATGEWTATIRNGQNSDKLVMDKLASPAYSKGLYTVQNPMGAEGAEVVDETKLVNGQRIISGYGRVYFRVGWQDTPADKNSNRYAIIDVTFNGNAETATLYCRQGQEPEELVSGNTILMSTYNVALPDQFTMYPTMAGYFYQWNDRTPYAPIGTLASYNTTVRHDVFDESRSVCPTGYGYPSEETITALGPILDNMDVHWGYYADGYFDRRAITNHLVNGSSVNVAYAGNLFYNPVNGKSMFTPTNGGRDLTGKFSLVRPGDPTQSTMMTGFWANYSSNANDAVAVFQYSDVKSQVGTIDKLSAISVRCVKLSGNTLYFDANGGSGAPRSITALPGTSVSIPQAPTVGLSQWHLCIGWNTRSDGKGTAYKFNSSKLIGSTDETLYAMWESMDNIRLSSGSTTGNFISDDNIGTFTYNSYVLGSNGGFRSTLDNALNNELAYPYLQFSNIGIAAAWTDAYTGCKNMAPAGQWRLPRISELYWSYRYDPNIWYNNYNNMTLTGSCFVSGTEVSSTQYWGIYAQNCYASQTAGMAVVDPKNNLMYYRCVKEIRPLQ